MCSARTERCLNYAAIACCQSIRVKRAHTSQDTMQRSLCLKSGWTSRRKQEANKRPCSAIPHVILNSHFARKCCGTVRAISLSMALSQISFSYVWRAEKKHSVIHMYENVYIVCVFRSVFYPFRICALARTPRVAGTRSFTHSLSTSWHIPFDAELCALLEHAYLNMVYFILFFSQFSLLYLCLPRSFSFVLSLPLSVLAHEAPLNFIFLKLKGSLCMR